MTASNMDSSPITLNLPFVNSLPPVNRFWWHALSDAERKALKDHAPEHVVSIVDGLSREEMKAIYESIGPLNTVLYYNDQYEWAKDTAWYLGHRIYRKPTDVEIIDEMGHNGNFMRYRLCYLAMHPDQVNISTTATAQGLELATDFFEEVFAARRYFEKEERVAISA